MSRIDFGAKPFLFPMPVLIIGTYDENGVPNAMNAAWGMVTDFQEITISLSEHKTTENFRKTGAFSVSVATEDTVSACDYDPCNNTYTGLGDVVGKAFADGLQLK